MTLKAFEETASRDFAGGSWKKPDRKVFIRCLAAMSLICIGSHASNAIALAAIAQVFGEDNQHENELVESESGDG